MSVKIRLKRMGTVKRPFNRIVVCDTKTPRDGRIIEELGFYDPIKEPHELKINKERALYWLSKGAIASATVKSLFKQAEVNK
ncbi:MAG: 30S ribosomal protein S16 [Candidatus Omnitrophota bacterium]